MPRKRSPHRVAIVAPSPVSMFNLAIPEMLFAKVEIDGAPGYEVTICSSDGGPVVTTGGLDLQVGRGLDVLRTADTVVLAGTGERYEPDPVAVAAVREAAAAGKRVASICSGAFLLAEAGLLDGRSATTYWGMADELRERYPALDLRGDVLYVQDGQVLTASGYAAGIDLCLHIIRTDYGAAVANEVARLALVAPVRPGGQTQFTQTPLPPERGTACADTRGWAMRNLDKPLTLTDLARHAGVSVRTLTRRFHAESGVSPLQWLLHQRVERAKELLETTTLPMDQVARACGLGTADSLRGHLVRRTGLTPSAYRAQFTRLGTGAADLTSSVA
ncbi:Transcriptional regulator GlxA family, contains an amidase domain and an AraC-type DNA-binding HTH domain [Streptomyces sp. 3213]|uniref:GlxA family transcriptional regulator n=1 Tax=Streptomyces sp. 3213.3 TaxID=1855348 RepID=UPI00089BE935|nr:helix-turn-helix domain-containing protein [Streptomyces sp. 3213.3]SED17935.1 Transcriptional regulator GlxA family, contains an amidase domain and an AraC-type DNA-binding HTH domain [Streptomyces sp. 3213] [Streptomyces sp. 3213.3]